MNLPLALLGITNSNLKVMSPLHILYGKEANIIGDIKYAPVPSTFDNQGVTGYLNILVLKGIGM